MWDELPTVHSKAWGKQASRSRKGRVQLANILFEFKKWSRSKQAISDFFDYLTQDFSIPDPSFPTPITFNYGSVSTVSPGILVKHAEECVEHFVRDRHPHHQLTSCEPVSDTSFSKISKGARVVKCVNEDDAKDHYTYRATRLFRFGRLGPAKFSGAELLKANRLRNDFDNMVDDYNRGLRVPPRTLPRGLEFRANFHTFDRALDSSIRRLGLSPANQVAKVLVAAGLDHFRLTPPKLLVILIFEAHKPAVCSRPTVFAARGGVAYCSVIAKDGFGRAIALGSGRLGAPEFVTDLQSPRSLTGVKELGIPKKRDKPAANDKAIIAILRAASR